MHATILDMEKSMRDSNDINLIVDLKYVHDKEITTQLLPHTSGIKENNVFQSQKTIGNLMEEGKKWEIYFYIRIDSRLISNAMNECFHNPMLKRSLSTNYLFHTRSSF